MPKPKATEVIATLKAELKDARAEIDRLKKELAGRAKLEPPLTKGYMSTLEKAAKANPDLPVEFIHGVLLGKKESKAGLSVPYNFDRGGIVKASKTVKPVVESCSVPEPVRGSSLRRDKAPRPKKELPPCRPDCRTFHAHIKGTP